MTLRALWQSLVLRLRSWFGPKAPPEAPPQRDLAFSGVALADTPTAARDDIERKALVLIGTPDRAKWLRFRCPCGCGEEMALSLMKSHHPRWTATLHDDDTMSVSPSVDSTTCGAHFWIRRNRIDWCD